MKTLIAIAIAAVGTAGALFVTQDQEKQCPSKVAATQTVSVQEEAKGCCGGCQGEAVAKKECCGKCKTEAVAKKECCGKCATEAVAKKSCCSGKTELVSAPAKQDGKCAGCTDDSCGEGCTVNAAMEKLPKMVFKVGTETTCCSGSAAALAKKHEAPIHYVVGKKEFSDESEAFTALVTETESFVKAFVTPKKCDVSGTTTVAGESCGCSVEAGKRAELVSAAIKDIKMEYRVGKKSACCPASANAMAKEAGEKVTYVVAGQETPCSQTARLNLAKAQYVAAVKAVAAPKKSECEGTECKGACTEKKADK